MKEIAKKKRGLKWKFVFAGAMALILLQAGTLKQKEFHIKEQESVQIKQYNPIMQALSEYQSNGLSIQKDGTTTAHKPGVYTVQVKCLFRKMKCNIYVFGAEKTNVELFSTYRYPSLFLGTSENATYQVEDESVVMVNEQGVMTAKLPGKTTITCKDGKLSQKVTVEVVGIKGKDSLAVGDTQQLQISKNVGKKEWKSEDPSVLQVDQNGKIKAVGGGKTTITCDIGEKMPLKKEMNVVGLNKTALYMEKDETQQLSLNSSSSQDVVSIQSANKKIAEVDRHGAVIAKNTGHTQIITTVNGKRLICEVYVLETQHTYVLLKGTKKKIGFEYMPNLTWKSSNPMVASVNDDGKVEGNAIGKTQLTADFHGKKVSCDLYTLDSKKKITLKKNRTKELTFDTEYPAEKITYVSANPKIASVEDNGTIFANKVGVTKIKVNLDKFSFTTTVEVKKEKKKKTTEQASTEQTSSEQASMETMSTQEEPTN